MEMEVQAILSRRRQTFCIANPDALLSISAPITCLKNVELPTMVVEFRTRSAFFSALNSISITFNSLEDP